MSEPEAEDEEELLLPIREAPVRDVVPPDELPDDWLDQPKFDPAGRPI